MSFPSVFVCADDITLINTIMYLYFHVKQLSYKEYDFIFLMICDVVLVSRRNIKPLTMGHSIGVLPDSYFPF